MNKMAIGFAVSASMLIVATQAMAHVGADSSRIIDLGSQSLDESLSGRIKAALAKPDVREALRDAYPSIISSYGRDGVSLVERVRVAQQAVGQDADFTSVGGGFSDPNAGACHATCHSACHGSRGWR